jgi:hypothetical protein
MPVNTAPNYNTNRRRLQCKILRAGLFGSVQTDRSLTRSNLKESGVPCGPRDSPLL